MLSQTILEVFTQAVPYRGPALTGFYYSSVFHSLKLRCSVGLGKAAGQTISTLPKGVVEVAALPDVSRLGAHVVRDTVVEVAFISKGAYFILLQGWKSYS